MVFVRSERIQVESKENWKSFANGLYIKSAASCRNFGEYPNDPQTLSTQKLRKAFLTLFDVNLISFNFGISSFIVISGKIPLSIVNAELK